MAEESSSKRLLREGLLEIRREVDYLLRILDEPESFPPEVDTTSHSLADPPTTKPKKKDNES